MLELAGIIILGILAQWVAWKFKIPAILPLILIGLLVGLKTAPNGLNLFGMVKRVCFPEKACSTLFL